MSQRKIESYTAFAGADRIATGSIRDVALQALAVVEGGDQRPVLVFDDANAHRIELDLRGPADEMLQQLHWLVGEKQAAEPAEELPAKRRGPGRPKLGVVGREVTLLPRHWDWLGAQPGGASVALRKLVEQARRANTGHDRVRKAQEATFRFMSALAGDEPGFEEATRALFAGDADRFATHAAMWPPDIQNYAARLAEAAFGSDLS